MSETNQAPVIAPTGSGGFIAFDPSPFAGVATFNYSAPTFTDLDGDGDLDLVMGAGDGGLRTWERTPTGFVEVGGAPDPFSGVDANPFAAVSVDVFSRPAFADLDADGDLDLIVGNIDGTLRVWQRSYNGLFQPDIYVELTGDANPFAGIDVGTFSAPTLTDLDGDGDLDLVVGTGLGTLRAWQLTAAGYEELTGAANPFDGIDVGFFSTPAFTDLDGDGDLDLVVGNQDGTLRAWQRTATGYEELVDAANPFDGIDVGLYGTPAFTDLDGDGLLDLVVGEPAGGLLAYRAITTTFVEETTGVVLAPSASDSDGDQLVWSLSGEDAALFAIDSATGSLSFVAAPNFEFPLDVGADNLYRVTLTVSDGSLSDSRDITIQVTDVAESQPVITSPAALEFVVLDPNPFADIDIGYASTPAFTDLDGDGDLDLVVGSSKGELRAWLRTEDGYEELTGEANPFAGISLSLLSTPAFVNIDGDGDLDLVSGSSASGLRVWERTTTGYVELVGSANPFADLDLWVRVSPAFVDLDGDGDLDLVVSDTTGPLRAFERTATGYEELVGAANPFADVDTGGESKPAFVDLDGDGDLDLVLSGREGTLRAWERTSTGYDALTGEANPFDGIDVGSSGAPAFADLDSDGDLDLVMGDAYGALTAYLDVTVPLQLAEGWSGVVLTPEVTDPDSTELTWSISGADAALFTIDTATGSLAFVVAPDFETPLDADADNVYRVTLTVSDGDYLVGRAVAIAVTDVNEAPVITAPASTAAEALTPNPFAGLDVGVRSTPAFVDLDGDGDLDLVSGDKYGLLHSFARTATGYEELLGAENPLAGIDAGRDAVPAFVDLDGDGDQDLVVGSFDGTLQVWVRMTIGYDQLLGAANPLGTIDVGYRSAPAFVDLDGDGDLDLVMGENYGTLRAWERTASGFEELTGTANPFAGIDVGNLSGPGFVDLDGDTDLDLVVGAEDGTLQAWERTETGYEALTGTSDPFAGADFGQRSAPGFADLDGDGDLDLVVGEKYGTLSALRNPVAPIAVAENTVGVVLTPAATDPENGTLTWSLTGEDAALFSVNTASGALSFRAAPDFESPLDVGADNLYRVTLTVSDGTFTDSRAVVIAVMDTNDAPVITGPIGARFVGVVPNPFAGIDVGFSSAPALADIDGDGDLDLVIGDTYGTLRTWARTPIGFEELLGSDNPFASINVGSDASPTFMDLDRDGDLDLVVGAFDGSLRAWERTATGFDELLGAENPFAGIDVSFRSKPAFGDIDGDGDLDLVLGDKYGQLHSWEQRATGFQELTGTDDPFAGADLGIRSTPAFADLDGDGDLDLVVGSDSGALQVWERTSTGFAAKGTDFAPLAGLVVGASAAPTFADIDGDGDLDLVVGEYFGSLSAVANPSATLLFAENTVTVIPAASATDEDGDALSWSLSGEDAALFTIDAVTGALAFRRAPDFEVPTDAGAGNTYQVTLTASDGLLSDSRALLIRVTDAAETFVPINPNPVSGVPSSFYNAPALADLDGDGDADLVLGNAFGLLSVYRNTGAGFEALPEHPLAGITLPSGDAAPAFADLDGDGDLDLILGDYVGQLTAYENTGTGFAAFAVDPFDGIDVGDISIPAFGDIDNDGDLDLVVGRADGTLAAFENQGGVFTAFLVNPLDGIDVGYVSSPAFADLDGDGDSDLVVGQAEGAPLAFENDGGTFAPFDADPLIGVNAIFSSRPSFGDLDGDGDADLVMAINFGNLVAYRNTLSPPNQPPEVTSVATADFAENGSGVIYHATATDPNGDTLSWTVTGEDAGLFTLDAATGALRFVESPDFEAPGDADGDNVYRVTLTVTDPAGAADSLDLALTVTNRDDPTVGAVLLQDQGSTLGADIASLADEDGITAIALRWQSSADGGMTWSDVAGATGTSFTPGLTERGTFVRVVAEVTDEGGNLATLSSDAAQIGTGRADILATTISDVTISWGLGGNDSIAASAATDGATLRGGGGDDLLSTTGLHAIMLGGVGNDTLLGGDAADTLDGGAGSDVLVGGAGDDVLIVRDAGDSTSGTAGDGIDTVRSHVDYALGDFVEALQLLGTATQGTGNAGDNLITGNGVANILAGGAGDDTMDGRGGDDVLIGGLGADLLTGNAGRDVFRYLSAAEGGDTITQYIRGQDQIEVSAAGFGSDLVAGTKVRFVANDTGFATTPEGKGQFVFETDAQTLWWDADGTGGSAAVALATFMGTVSITAAEITVIA